MGNKKTIEGFADTNWVEPLLDYLGSMKTKKVESIANNIMTLKREDVDAGIMYIKALSDFRRDLENGIKTYKEDRRYGNS
jgi:hypothetical protein